MTEIPQEIYDILEAYSFRGNSKIRGVGIDIEYTQEMLDEYEKCMNDPVHFINNYCKTISVDKGIIPLHLYDYQVNLVNTYVKERKVVTMQPRQSGKCVSINTKVRLKQKSTGKIIEITLGEFYVWKKAMQQIKELFDMQNRV